MSSFTTELEYTDTGKTYRSRKIFRIEKAFKYAVGDLGSPLITITVPVGYETDFATIPWPLNIVFRPDGPWSKAAVIHDFLYTDMPQISKIIADSIFLEAMIVLNVNVAIAYLFYLTVRFYQQFVNK